MDKWERRAFGLRPVDVERLERLGRKAYPGQVRTGSLVVRMALIALERDLDQRSGELPVDYMQQMEKEKGK